MTDNIPMPGTPLVIKTPQKRWFQSTTFWINVLGILALVIQQSLNDQIIPYKYQALALGLINLYQRFRTFQALTL